MKKLGVISLFVLISIAGYADETGTIKGRVTDAKDNSAITDAVVRLSPKGDSTVITGAVTDKNGSFELDKIPNGMYTLRISFVGYSELHVNNVAIDDKMKLRTFDTLKLKQGSATTDEIDVEANRQFLTMEGEKKVFDVSKSMLTKGGTALDVLKTVPMVDVDINDNVSLRGSQNVKILVDDKPSRYASLKQVPADAIEKVEVITNPPAKYEAEGVTGIINIVMKKSDLLGFTGNANVGGSYGERFRGWSGFNFNVKKKKTTMFASLYNGIFNFAFNYNAAINYSAPVSTLSTLGGGKGDSKYLFGQFGVEYELSQGKSLGFQGNYGFGKWENVDTSTAVNYDNLGSMSSFYTETGGRNGTWNSINAEVYFNNKIDDKGSEINADLSFNKNINTNDFRQLKQDYLSNYQPANFTPLDQKDSTKLSSYNVNAQLDYTHPFSQTSKLETGFKGTYRINDNNFLSDTVNYSLNGYVNDQTVSNRFKLSEYINALYGTFSGAIGDKLTYKLGLRLEQTNSKGELLTGGQSFTKSYLDYFPSVNISEKIGPADQLQFSYSRRITRPNIWRMNPFLNRHDARSYMEGNPDLNPEYTNSFELSFLFFTKPVTITPVLFYRRSTDIITAYSYLIDSSISLTTFRNLSGSNAYGMDLIINSASLGWMNMNATLSFYNTKYDNGDLTDYASEDGFSWKANIRSTFVVGSLFNIEAFYTYTGKKLNGLNYNLPNSNFDIGISKSFLDNKLSLTLKASDIFHDNSFRQVTSSAGYNTSVNHFWDSRNWSLSLNYNFGNTTERYQNKNKTKRNQNENHDQQDSNGNGM